MPSQGVLFGGFVIAGVLVYSAVTDNSIIDVLTGKATGGKGDVDKGGSGTAGAATGSVGVGSGLGGAAQAAMKAYHQKQNYRYAEIRPIPGNLFGNPPITTDCSGFVTLCYKAAGLPDPNGAGYDGSGDTGTLIAHSKRARSAVPGLLCFYGGTMDFPQHVAIYVGGGKVVSHGQPGDPELIAANLDGAVAPFYGYFMPSSAGGKAGVASDAAGAGYQLEGEES